MPDPFDLDDDIPLPGGPSPLPVPPWLAGLNPEQRQAVETTDGPLLVLSGAGTGKTRVLTTRLAHILAARRAQPWQCLAVTFTNKAAREMRERLAAMVGPVAESVWLGTFHAVGMRILRRHAEALGLQSNFTILDSDDQLRLVKQVMEAEGVDGKAWPAQAVLAMIQRWKDRGLVPAKASDDGETGGAGIRLYELYQQRLLSLNAVDFGDLLLHCLTLFQQEPAVLEEYQQRFHYLLVDEYQDTNVAQYLWLRLLAQKHKNICCVGDDDQSIYSWRGAEVGNILRFEHDFPGARVVRLERNYRSTPNILAAASGLIGHNAGRLGKTLRPGDAAAEAGHKIEVRGVWDGREEARVAVEEIEALHRAGTKLREMAVLVRTGSQTREFEERLIVTGVPYKVLGGLRFYERQEIRDALAYLRIVVQPADDLAFERIVNLPKRGLGEAALQSIHQLSRAQQVPLLEAARRLCETDELKPKPRVALSELAQCIADWRRLVESMPPGELTATVLDESGYTDMWKADKSADAPGRLENLKELVAGMEEYESLQAFLEHVSLVMENDDKAGGDHVVLMTLHGAKGLEFDAVFLPGWEEGLFPHQRALDSGGAEGLEEERRLAYVGLTRARRRVFVSYAANRRIYNQFQVCLPSRFLEELPKDHVEWLAATGLYGAAPVAEDPWAGGWNRPVRQVAAAAAPQEAWQSKPAGGGGEAVRIGDRVFHQKFGYGLVQGRDGNKLEVAFDKAGTKKVIDSFVEMA